MKSRLIINNFILMLQFFLASASSGAEHIQINNWGISASQIDKAWQITQGSSDIIVAVIDTGIDVSHPDLRNKLWKNPGESGLDKNGIDRAFNGIDDDKNGFIDDQHGWNFVASDPDISDSHGHGTHIAGIIAADNLNKKGTEGAAPNVKLMVLKYYDSKAKGGANLANTVEAIKYATKMGAHIINYSGGGPSSNVSENQALKQAEKKGVLVVAAAGNESSNTDKNRFYPANYDLKNIISVSALNIEKSIIESSNFGPNTVDIAAPGENIYSTLPQGSYGTMTGTSQATAFVTGICALILSKHKSFFFKPVATKNYLLKNVEINLGLKNRVRSGGAANGFKAVYSEDVNVTAMGIPLASGSELGPDLFSFDAEKFKSKIISRSPSQN